MKQFKYFSTYLGGDDMYSGIGTIISHEKMKLTDTHFNIFKNTFMTVA